ncbi:MAG TPA: alpha/beta hydrolase [Rhodocyclaceae bacterium]
MSELLQAIEIETGATPDAAVIWLHGLGADGSDFVPIVPELRLPPALKLRFVFPHAQQMPVTCNGGYVMPAWYDIISLDPDNRVVDGEGIERSRQAIEALIAREVARGIATERIVIAGFSQGGAIAYATALRHPAPLAGVIALSTYIPEPDPLFAGASEANRTIPLFAAHGVEDDVVSLKLGTRARDELLRRGYVVDWHEYPMPHSVCIEEIVDIGRWLTQTLAPTDAGAPR